MARYGTDLVQGIPSPPAAWLTAHRSKDPVKASLQKSDQCGRQLCAENDGAEFLYQGHRTTRMPLHGRFKQLRSWNFGTPLAKPDIALYPSPGISTSAEW